MKLQKYGRKLGFKSYESAIALGVLVTIAGVGLSPAIRGAVATGAAKVAEIKQKLLPGKA